MAGIHDGHRQRLRSRFLTYGMDALEEHEVLELLLFYVIARQDTNPLAHALIKKFGSLSGVMDASFSELTQVEGIGPQAATLLLLCKPMCRRYLISRNDPRKQLTTVESCSHFLSPFFFGAKEEQVFVLCLDAQCKPICCRQLSEGSATATELPIRKITQLALDSRATSVILAHNHPGGTCQPSPEDYTLTKTLRDTLEPLGIRLADHILFDDTTHASMAASGFFY